MSSASLRLKTHAIGFSHPSLGRQLVYLKDNRSNLHAKRKDARTQPLVVHPDVQNLAGFKDTRVAALSPNWKYMNSNLSTFPIGSGSSKTGIVVDIEDMDALRELLELMGLPPASPSVSAVLPSRPSSEPPNAPAIVAPRGSEPLGDTYDDCPAQDPSQLGSDHPGKGMTQRSFVKRDMKVREAVLWRAGGKCERKDCDVTRDFVAFFDVHHILGAGTSDRVWNCVALCPNCHREAHYSPHAERINAELLRFARSFELSKGSAVLG